jgi:hypothetical protein
MTFSRRKDHPIRVAAPNLHLVILQETKATGHVSILESTHRTVRLGMFPRQPKRSTDELRESDADVLNVARLDEACLPGGYGNKAHWFVKRGALVYLYYSQDITDLFLFNTLHHRAHAMQATPPRHISTHYVLLAILQMTSPAVCYRCG